MVRQWRRGRTRGGGEPPRRARAIARVDALVVLVVLAGGTSGCGASDEPAPEPPPGPPAAFVAMTFNVLCSFCGGAEYDPWGERLESFRDLFARHEPDLIGLQELAFESEVGQVLDLRAGFAAVYYRAEESGFSYPDAALLYRIERFEALASGAFWLSPTPDLPSSKGFSPDQVAPRLVVWAELRDRQSRRRLFAASTHFDNNPPCQELSAPLVVERTAPWRAEAPVVLLGDFNSQPADPAYELLTEGGEGFANAQALADEWVVDANQSPVPAYDLAERIDHIFVAPQPEGWSVAEWLVDLHVYGPAARYPSDHRAMVATLRPPALD